MAERIAEENLSNLFKSFKNPLACISIVYDLLDLGGFVGFLAVRRLNIILTHPPQSHGFPAPSLLPQSLPPTPQTRAAVLHTVQHRRRLSPLADRQAKVRIKALSPEPFAPAFAFFSSLVREVLAALLAQLVLCGVINYLLRNPV